MHASLPPPSGKTVHQSKKRIDNHSHSVQSVKSFTKWYIEEKMELHIKWAVQLLTTIIFNNLWIFMILLHVIWLIFFENPHYLNDV